VVIEKQILWLEVAVDDAAVVKVLDCQGGLVEETKGQIRR
jgi:hypothetical protein